jgi:O-succinylhomoserine sulfhydrylase
VILASREFIDTHIHNFLRQTGPAMSPFNAWVMLKGSRRCRSGSPSRPRTPMRPRRFSRGKKGIARVLYPGRDDHPQVELARRQMTGGGTLVTFDMHGGKAAAFRFANALDIINISNNLGDAKSLITHPATTTHQRLTPEQRASIGIGDGMLRLSVGIEDIDDLIEDLQRGLAAL